MKRFFKMAWVRSIRSVIMVLMVLITLIHALPVSATEPASVPICVEVYGFNTSNVARVEGSSLLWARGDASTSNGILRVVPASSTKSGSVVRQSKVKLSGGFSTYFVMNLNGGTSPPADGLTFIVQDNTTPETGAFGGGIGYRGIPNSFGVELDIWNNGTKDGSYGVYDSLITNGPSNHVAIVQNGSNDHSTTNANAWSVPEFRLHGNDIHVWVDYAPDGTLYVAYGLTENYNEATKFSKNLGSTFADKDVYIGFAASTGNSTANHDIKKWYFSNTYVSGGLSPVEGTYMQHPISGVQIDLARQSASSTSVNLRVKDTANSYMANETVSLYIDDNPTPVVLNTGIDGLQANHILYDLPLGSHTIKAIANDGTVNEETFYIGTHGLVVPLAPSGSGLAEEPYLIAEEGNLLWMSENNDSYWGFYGKYFRQTADIDMSGVTNLAPIGSNDWFEGTYDGNNFKISNLTMSSNDYGSFGLFGIIYAGTVKNLELNNIAIASTNTKTGGLVGEMWSGTISNVHITGNSSVAGYYEVGGIVGYMSGGLIEQSSNAAHIAGFNSNSGFYVGGIAGMQGEGNITDSYNTGAVTGYYAGGITGYAYSTGYIKNCYNLGTITGRSYSGGIVGALNLAVLQNNFYLNTSAAAPYGKNNAGIDFSAHALAKRAAELKYQLNFSGWDFTNTWSIVNTDTHYSYPYLKNSSWIGDETQAPGYSLKEFYTVTYNGNGNTGGTVPSDSSYEQGQSVLVLDNSGSLVKTGYSFAGWNTQADGNGTDYAVASPLIMRVDNVTLYAKWNINQYIVNFNSNGGSEVTSQTVNYNETATPPTPPTKTGYTFAGWYTDEELTIPFNFTTAITGNATFYAKWNINQYIVNFNSNGGSEVTSQTVSYNTLATEPTAPTKTGYTFAGWYTEEELTIPFNFTTAITKDITLHAKWTINSYTVTFDSQGGSSVESKTADYNTTISAPVEPIKEGYNFEGWYKEEALTNAWNFETDTVPAENINLYAKWNINQYTVTFKEHDGTTIETQTVDHGSGAIAPTEPTRAGYTFTGWDTGFDNVTGDLTVTATYTINSYTVTFDSQGGSSVESITADYDTTIMAPEEPTKAGYTFDGWYKEAENINAWDFSDDTVRDNTTLYAKWNINQYTVTFKDHDGTTLETQTVTHGSGAIDPTEPTRAGYTFSGWDTTFANVTGDLTVTATYTINSYTVTFNSNGGSEVTSQTVSYNTLATEPTAPTKTGYTFAGWYTDSNLTIAYEFTTAVIDYTNLYAKWNINQYNVTFDSQGGSSVESKTADYNTTISAPVEPTKDGYNFEGWYKEEALTNAWNFGTDTVPAEDITLYANWNIKQYTVAFEVYGGSTLDSQTINHGEKATEPSAPVKAGYIFGGWYTDSSYVTLFNFATTNITGNTSIYAKWIATSRGGGGSTSISNPNSGTNIVIDGTIQENVAQVKTEVNSSGQAVATVTISEDKLKNILNSLPVTTDNTANAIIQIPVSEDADVVSSQLNGQIVKDMENKAVVLEIKTEKGDYILPAEEINIDAISEQVGKNVKLSDIEVKIKIATSSNDTVKVVEDLADKGNFNLVVPPVEFDITCTYENKTVAVNHFNSYIERTLAIPNGVDPAKITTGIVIETDGTVRHVPTKVVLIEGRYYAQINSLTNSTYSVIWNPMEFKDVETHWAKEAVNDMGSRMVINGVGNYIFEPNREITRAEFAAIVVRALGLKPGTGKNSFTDVKSTDWYSGYVTTATEYKLINGYGEGRLGPKDKITREQAMTMIARAMQITGLKMNVTNTADDKVLAVFSDVGTIADYSRSSIVANVRLGIVAGRGDNLLAPKEKITRAEVAVIIKRLLQKSDLI